MTRNEKMLAIAKKALYQIARSQAESPDATANWALGKIAEIKAKAKGEGG